MKFHYDEFISEFLISFPPSKLLISYIWILESQPLKAQSLRQALSQCNVSFIPSPAPGSCFIPRRCSLLFPVCVWERWREQRDGRILAMHLSFLVFCIGFPGVIGSFLIVPNISNIWIPLFLRPLLPDLSCHCVTKGMSHTPL